MEYRKIKDLKELRAYKSCYYINKWFPGVVNEIKLDKAHKIGIKELKAQLKVWIEDEKIYVRDDR